MKYTTVYVKQLEKRNGKPWQARAKYKDVYGKWREVSKMMTGAKGIREAKRMANEWLNQLNAEADLMPNVNKAMLPQLEQALRERKTLINPLDSWYVIGEGEEFT